MGGGPVCGLTSQGAFGSGQSSKARPAPPGNDTRVRRYAQRALALFREAEELLPAKERETFWRDHVQGDPALLQLVRTYEH